MATLRELTRQIVHDRHTLPAVLESLRDALNQEARQLRSRGEEGDDAVALEGDADVLDELIEKHQHRFAE